MNIVRNTLSNKLIKTKYQGSHSILFLLQSDPVEIRRSTGIPRSFMVPVEGPKAPGAMMTPSGSFAVPAVDQLVFSSFFIYIDIMRV